MANSYGVFRGRASPPVGVLLGFGVSVDGFGLDLLEFVGVVELFLLPLSDEFLLSLSDEFLLVSELLLELPLSAELSFELSDLLLNISRVVELFFFELLFVLLLLEFFFGLSEINSSIFSESSSSEFFLIVAGSSSPSGFSLLVTTKIICPVLTVSPAFGSCSKIVFGFSLLNLSARFLIHNPSAASSFSLSLKSLPTISGTVNSFPCNDI